MKKLTLIPTDTETNKEVATEALKVCVELLEQTSICENPSQEDVILAKNKKARLEDWERKYERASKKLEKMRDSQILQIILLTSLGSLIVSTIIFLSTQDLTEWLCSIIAMMLGMVSGVAIGVFSEILLQKKEQKLLKKKEEIYRHKERAKKDLQKIIEEIARANLTMNSVE